MFNRVRWRLTAWYVSILSAMLLAFIGFLYVGLEGTLWQEEDEELRHYLGGGRYELHYDSEELGNDGHDELPPHAAVWILDGTGRTLKAIGAPALTVSPDRKGLELAMAAGEGRGHTFLAGELPYRSYTMPVRLEQGQQVWAQAAEPAGRVMHVLGRMLWLMLGVAAAAVLVAGLAGLALANRALVPIRAAWQRQRDFASDASHELRTPLAVVQAAADLLGASIPPGTPDAQILADLKGATRRMRELVDDLLLLARADSGRLELVPEPVNLAGLVQGVLAQLRHLAADRQISLDYAGPAEAWLVGDRRRLEQMLTTLVDNAIRHHRPPGWVRVSMAMERGRVVLQVADNGPGIPAAHLPRIFDRFYRADPARGGGAGLGLAIARELAQAHGGTIRAQSSEGQGSTFTVELPAGPVGR